MRLENVGERNYVVADDNIRLFVKKSKAGLPHDANDFSLALMEFPGDWLIRHSREDLVKLVEKRAGNALWHLFEKVLQVKAPKCIIVAPDETVK